jgi:hypothetical protein
MRTAALPARHVRAQRTTIARPRAHRTASARGDHRSPSNTTGLVTELRDAIHPWTTGHRGAAVRVWLTTDDEQRMAGCEVWAGIAGDSLWNMIAAVPSAIGVTRADVEAGLSAAGFEFRASDYGTGAAWQISIDADGRQSYFLTVRRV